MTAKTTPPPTEVPLTESKIPWVECSMDDAPEGDPHTDEERRLLAEAHADIASSQSQSQSQSP